MSQYYNIFLRLFLCTSSILFGYSTIHAQSFVSISAGGSHSLGLKADGSLWAWGNNRYGQLGDGTTTDQHTPKPVGAGYTSVSAGGIHTLGLRTDGTLWAWGYADTGMLGIGIVFSRYDSNYITTPTLVGEDYMVAAAGDGYSLGLKCDGTLWGWGPNDFGQIGDGSKTTRYEPVQVGEGVTAVACGGLHSLRLKSDESTWACGVNAQGQLGAGTTTLQHLTPILANGIFVAIAAGARHSLGLKSDGTLWTWGYNGYGQLGDGTLEDKSTPAQVGESFSAISGGGVSEFSLGLKTDGTLWTWGRNHYGQLGNGSHVDSPIPIQIGEGFVSISASVYHCLGLKSDGSLWAWGNNDSGQLGDGATTDRLVPTLIDSGSGEQYRYYVPYAPGAVDFALGFGISNAGNAEPAGVVVDYYNNHGVHLGQDFTTIPAGGHASFMRELALNEDGWARVTASQPVEGMALAFGAGDDPMFDMDFKATLATNLSAAHVDTGANWISKAMLANPNGEEAHVTITFHADDGATQTADLAIPALGASQYDLASAFPGLAGAIEVESDQGLAGFILYDGRALGNYVGGLSMTPGD